MENYKERQRERKTESISGAVRERDKGEGMTDKPSGAQREHCEGPLPSRARQETKSDGRVRPAVHEQTLTG